ncbi:MAG: serine--tRNA ligase, partial [candidate division WWE3 bacterium]|nr:serine--tRNA ligase [candidate division WWE3 bacterium]
DIKSELKNLEPQLKNIEEQLEKLLWQIPNLIHPKVPRGFEEKNNKIIKSDKPVKFPFKSLDHEQLAQKLDLIDFEAGSQVAGSKFYYLKNEAVLLEFALIKYAFDILLKEGFTPLITPDLAKSRIIDGVGFVPRGPESNIYSLEGEDLGLIGTAEITLGGYHAGQILEEKDFPLKYAGFSHCFRREAGSYGQYSKGLYRVHQFSKVEMFLFCRPRESDKLHEYLLSLEEKIFRGLEIPYRVVDIRAGDLGAAAYRKFDLEAWMPGRGEWGEITSTSNTTDYQARRLNIKYRQADGTTEFVHTLNGTAIATSRALIAILENYQKEDGSVGVPKVLAPYVGKKIIRR